VSYFGHLHVTFQVPPYHRIFLPRFLFTAAVGMLINVGIAWLFSEVFPIPYPAIIAIVLVVLPLASYLVSRFWIYFPVLDGRAPADVRGSQTHYD
jgi:putative flippase GtrA